MTSSSSQLQLVSLTVFSLLAFAANSILCRLALATEAFDPYWFSVIRIASAALLLSLLALPTMNEVRQWRSALTSSFFLSLYVFAFSYSYVELDAGVGAFILFSSVQIMMTVSSIKNGQQVSGLKWFGMTLVLVGLAMLLLPSELSSSEQAVVLSIKAVVLMLLAAVGWVGFLLAGLNSPLSQGKPLLAVAIAFRWSLVWAFLVSLVMLLTLSSDSQGTISQYPISLDSISLGLVYAILSGAVASGIGYAVWYKVLPQLGVYRAGQIQVSVPAITVLIAVLVLNEIITAGMWLAIGVMTVGLLISVYQKPK